VVVSKKSCYFGLFLFKLNSSFKNQNLTFFKVDLQDKDIFNGYNHKKITSKSVVDTDNSDEMHEFEEYAYEQKKC